MFSVWAIIAKKFYWYLRLHDLKRKGVYIYALFFIATSCCLHATTDGILSGKILSFNTYSTRTCQEALRIWKKNQLKYGRAILLDCLPSSSGYHLDCHEKFTALSKTHKKYLREITETLQTQPENKITLSSSKLDKTNRVGILS